MPRPLSDDPVVQMMKKADIPITRENWINTNWMGEPPDPWTAEAEDEVPGELQDWSKVKPDEV